MKKLTILFTFLIAFSQLSQAQIIDSLPYFKQDRIMTQTLNPFFETLVLSGWDEGVAAIKSYIDPDFKPPAKGWMKKEFVEPLGYYLGQAYTSEGQFKLLDEFEQTMFGSTGYSELLGVEYAHWYAKLPAESPDITKRGSFDPIRHFNPKEISWEKWMPWEIRKAVKNDPASLNRYFGLILVKKPNGNFLIFPDAAKFLPDGTATRMKTTGDVNVHGRSVSSVKNGQPMGFKGSDEELQVARQTADNFLKAIRENDRKAFRQAFGNNTYIEEVWTDMRPLALYQKLPEYKSSGLKLERIVSFENQAGWRGHFSFHVAVYRLPEGMKASELRAPTDFFNPVVFPSMDASSKEPGYKAKAGKGGFTKTPDNYDIIFGGPLIGTLIGDNDPENYLTITMERAAGTNNFNIGMPPSLK